MADENPTNSPPETPSELTEPPPESSRSPPPEPISVTEKETPLDSSKVTEEVIEPEKPNPVEQSEKVPQALGSFKEESNKISDLSDLEKRALDELKNLVQDHEFTIWGVPLLQDERTDVILLKFLRARDFKVKEAFSMLKNTVKWRNDFGIEALIEENLCDDLEKVVFADGFDKEGHPVCYNVYGEFQNKELYQKTFGDEEKRSKFLRWRIQFLERSIRKLDFSPGGVSTIFQVSDLKNAPGPGKRELRLATKQALQLLQDNYPEFVAKQLLFMFSEFRFDIGVDLISCFDVRFFGTLLGFIKVFINVPWWYLAFYSMVSPFMTQRTKSKFVFASPAKTPETLFKYVAPEQVPIQYGGLSVDFCDCNPEFTHNDPASEITIKPATKQTVEILVNEKCIIVWELRVVGWEVSYSAEYVPRVEGGYTIIIQKAKKMSPTDEPVVSSSFKITELGKLLLTIDNSTSKKKKLLYRFKVEPLCD